MKDKANHQPWPARWLVFVLALWVLAQTRTGPASAQQAGSMPPLVQEIAGLVNRHTSLIMKRDAAGLAALFAPDGVYVAANGSTVAGQAGIHGYYAAVFQLLNQNRDMTGPVTRETAIERAGPWGDGAWAIGRGANIASGAEGKVVTTDHWMALYRKIDGQWRIQLMSVGEDTPRK
jgi:uncharacterized protein (TIGR02246 family)